MNSTSFTLLLAILLPIIFTSCGDAERPREERPVSDMEADAGMDLETADDTTELRGIYDNIDAHHQQLMARYRSMAGQLDADLEQIYDYMGQMHGSATQMHHGMMGGDRHMMGRGMHGPGTMEEKMMQRRQTQEWDRQMLTMHEQLGQYMRRQGYDQMAAMHEQMTQYYREAANAFSETDGQSEAGPPSPEGEINGQAVFEESCASCHGASGSGLTPAFPPLAGSDWVTGDRATLIRIVLHGLEGEIKVQGLSYSGMMPAFGARLSNDEIAAVLSYVRSSWGHDAPAVTASEVHSVRQQYLGRTQPWTSEAVREE